MSNDDEVVKLAKLKQALAEMMKNQKVNQEGQQAKKLDTWFKYHAPTPEDVAKYDKINESAKAFARVIFEECVPGKDQEMALWLIRQARMTANSSIACKGV